MEFKLSHRTGIKYYLAVAVSLLTFLVYLPALRNGFVNWDDGTYVFDNPYLHSLNGAFLKWAFFDFYASNWHPVTWISHAVDYAIWGLNPMGHHLTNNILHAINTFLVVLLVAKLIEAVPGRQPSGSQEVERSGNDSTTRQLNFSSPRFALIAAGVTGLLFGLHPLHVESVAWVAERKDLLCALFFLLSIMSYVKYAADMAQSANGIGHGVKDNMQSAERKGRSSRNIFPFAPRSMLYALCFFALALMSKPMAVSLPLVLLILDWYPIERIKSLKTLMSAVVEKIPFFLFALASSVLTILAQKSGGSMEMMGFLPFSTRMLIAAKSLMAYLWNMAFPFALSPYYPYPSTVSLFSPAFFTSVALASGTTVLCLFFVRKQKVWPVLWGYYVATLIPVLGIVQVGGQAMADRYSYLPSLAPFLLAGLGAAWLFRLLAGPDRGFRILAQCGLAAALYLVFGMAHLTANQIGVWKDSIHLWSFVIKKEPARVPLAYNNRGLALVAAGRYDEAIEDFSKAIALRGDYYEYIGRGRAFEETGQLDRALADFSSAISMNPSYKTYYARGVLFERRGEVNNAINDYQQAIVQNPVYLEALIRLGILYGKSGSIGKAIETFDRAIEERPNYAVAYANRGFAYSLLGRYDEATRDFTTAIELDKNDVNSYFNRGTVYLRIGRKNLAMIDFQRACALGEKGGCKALEEVK